MRKEIYKKIFIEALIVFFYLSLSLILTYPLILNFFTAIPGIPGDAFIFLWNQWWVREAILTGQSPFFTQLIAYPFQANLAFSSLTFTNSLISVPAQFILPPVVVFNLIFIFSLVAAAYGMYFLIKYLFNNHYAGLVGGAVFAFNAYIFQEMFGHFNYTSVYPIPFFILFFLKIFKEDKKYFNSILAALFLALAFYNDHYYTIGLLIFSFFCLVWLGFKERKLLVSKTRQICLVFFCWLIIIMPLLTVLLKGVLSKLYPLANLAQINLYAPDLRSFLVPASFQTIYGQYFINYYHSLGFHGSVVYLSFSLIILAILGYLVGRKKEIFSANFWLVTGVIFLFFCLGPFLYLDGYIFDLDGIKYTIPLPYLLFYFVPFVKGILVPPRLIIFVIFCLVMMAGFILVKIFNQLKSQIIKLALTILIIGLYLAENLAIPIPISTAKIPNFYYNLSKDKEDGVILELPFALSTSFYTLGSIPSSSIIQYYQTVHQKKILGGWISRAPDEYYSFYSRLAGLDYLINPQEKIDNKKIDEISNRVRTNFQKLKIKYIIVHPEYYYHQELANSLNFLNQVLEQKPKLVEQMYVYQMN